MDAFTSLMDLATTDTTEVSSIKSRLQAEGIYVILWNEVGMREAENDDPEKAPRITLRLQGTIEFFAPLKEDAMTEEQVEQMVGKSFNDFKQLYMDDVPQAIGLLKGQYERAKFPTAGPLGGVDGVTGWVDGVIGQRCGIRVRHSNSANGDTRAYIDWLSPKELKKAGITWDEMGREAMNPDGTPVDEDKLYK